MNLSTYWKKWFGSLLKISQFLNLLSFVLSGVCTLRLDFESFDLLAGSGTRDPESECRDVVRFSYTSSENHFNNLPTICGYNTGEHSKDLLYEIENTMQEYLFIL